MRTRSASGRPGSLKSTASRATQTKERRVRIKCFRKPSRTGVMSVSHHAVGKTKEIMAMVDSVMEAKVNEIYKTIQKECSRMRTSIISHMMISRRLQDDTARLEARVNILSAARYYLSDKINDQARTILKSEEIFASIQNKVEGFLVKLSDAKPQVVGGADQGDKSGEVKIDPVTYRLCKDSRLKAIGNAVDNIKTNLSWGNYSGTTSELEDIFKEVQDLL